MSFNEALAHLMIAKGSVAHPREVPNGIDKWRWETDRFGSYYHDSIEAPYQPTVDVLSRIDNGAFPIYNECGPSDFGQNSRFNHTFTETQLVVHYALFPIVFSDQPGIPVDFVAGISALENSFVKTLEKLFTGLTFEEAVEQMRDRVTTPSRYPGDEPYSVTRPKLW